MDSVKTTAKKIKSLKIQGASKIRELAMSALVNETLKSKAKSPGQFRKEFLENAKILFNARPTEPALRTGIRVLKKSISEKDLDLNEMKKRIALANEKYENERKKFHENIASYGAKLIEPHSTILTLCHSHMVVDVLIKAKKKIDHVYCCETRPLFQGRITAKELSSAGIKVTLIVDNAASTVLKKCDYFFTGADAFLADGDVINKIGTNQISTLCRRYDTKHYVACATHKFEPATFFGKSEPMEQRDTKEVLAKKIPRVKVINPAFDRTDSKLIEGIICEIGVFPPQVLASRLYTELQLDKHEVDFLKL
jgi:ribose 1,5-bisphosphate isomerase